MGLVSIPKDGKIFALSCDDCAFVCILVSPFQTLSWLPRELAILTLKEVSTLINSFAFSLLTKLLKCLSFRKLQAQQQLT